VVGNEFLNVTEAIFRLCSPFDVMERIVSDHMHYLYQKDERALPGNVQNRRYSFLFSSLLFYSLLLSSLLFSSLLFSSLLFSTLLYSSLLFSSLLFSSLLFSSSFRL
jgi:hypothetical protein